MIIKKIIILLILALITSPKLVHGQNYENTPFSSVPYVNSTFIFESLPYDHEFYGFEYVYNLPVYVYDEEGYFGIVPELFLACTPFDNFFSCVVMTSPLPELLWFDPIIQVFNHKELCSYTIEDVYKQGDYVIQDVNDISINIFNVTGEKISANKHVISLSGSEQSVSYVLISPYGGTVEEKQGTGSAIQFSPVWYPVGTYTVRAIATSPSGGTIDFLMNGNYTIPSRNTWSQITSEYRYRENTAGLYVSNIISEPSDVDHTYSWQALNSSGNFITIAGHSGANLDISMTEFKSKTRNDLQNQRVRRVTKADTFTLYSNDCVFTYADNSQIGRKCYYRVSDIENLISQSQIKK